MGDIIDLAKYKYTLSLDSSGYSGGMKAAESQAETMKTKLANVGTFLKTSLVAGLAAAGAAITGTIVAGVKATADLDEQMSQFKATTGATAEEADKIQDLSQELFKTNTDSMEDIVATATEMKKSMGMSVEEIQKYQQAYMDYAKTTGQSNTDVVKAIDDIGDAWGLTAEDSVQSLDMLKLSSEQFGTDISSVQGALTQVAPASKALGLSIEETNGYMNLFSASGLDASQSITAFTYASKQVQSPEQFKQMVQDISSISDPTARAQKAVELFGSKAGVAMANVDTSQLDNFIISMDEATGTVSKASGEFDSNFNVQLELMKKQFIGLAQEVGEKFMPVINDALAWVTENMPAIVETIESAIDTIGAIIDPFIQIIRNIIKSFKDVEGQSNTSFEAVKETISSIIGTIQGIVQGFIDFFNVIWDKWGSDIVESVQLHFKNVTSVIANAFNFIQNLVDFFIAFFKGDWTACFDSIKNIASSAWELIKSIFKTGIDFINNILTAGLTLMGTIASNLMNLLWSGIKRIWDNIKTWFKDIINKLLDWFGNLGESFFNVGANILNWVWDGLKSVWENIYNWVEEKVAWMIEKLTFWRKSQEEMEEERSSSKKKKKRADGSHRDGLDYVPWDGYTAILHKGERVLTAQQNAAYSSNYNTPITINMGNITVSGGNRIDANEIGRVVKNQLDESARKLSSKLKLRAYQVAYN